MTSPVLTPAVEAPPVPAKPARKALLPALTGVRTFLAVNIMLFHFTPSNITWIVPIVGHGFVFVGFFLLISGFILSYNYSDRGASLNKRDFWIARLARFYPVYLLSLVISIPVLIEEFHVRNSLDFWEGAIATPLLLQGWSPWLSTFWNTVAWTISTEAFFYLIFPFLLRINWPKSMAKLVLLALGAWAIGLIPHAVYIFLNPDGLANVDRYSYGYYLRGLKFTPLPYLGTFIVGTILGRIHGLDILSQRVRGWMAAVAVAVLLLYLYFVADHVPYVLMHGGLLTPIFALLILGVTGRNPVSAFFGWKPFVLIGEATLCIYLLHFNTLQMLRDYHVAERLHIEALDPWIWYVALIVFSYGLYRFYEDPMRRWVLSRFTKRHAA